jgi:uncharacterized FAD-dependent dehydrogenase
VYNIEVVLSNDPGKDDYSVHAELIEQLMKSLSAKDDVSIKKDQVTIVRKSFDGRWKKVGQPKFVYTCDINLTTEQCKKLKLRSIEGKIESINNLANKSTETRPLATKPKVVIVGAGPAGLYCAIELVKNNISPIIIERGQPVEIRGRDIGKLFHRKMLDPNSNLCYGIGGAGTWSDGKLTTRIGKNSDDVRSVLQTLVDHGANPRILIDGKPHIGTDGLVRVLKDVRKELTESGSEFKFSTIVTDVVIEGDRVKGVQLASGEFIPADIVVLAIGHSSRDLYEKLIKKGLVIEVKPIAAGFRVEHPQNLINKIQLGEFGSLCENGKGKVPVADYKLATEVIVDDASNGGTRSVYSFCMCPGGQIVPTSVNPDELCVNGMSFSQRQSKWANSALVVNVNPSDMQEVGGSSPFCGVLWQKTFERKAAIAGGGNLVAPVQRVTDFLQGKIHTSSTPITSSYRMGVKEAACHEIYPAFITESKYIDILPSTHSLLLTHSYSLTLTHSLLLTHSYSLAGIRKALHQFDRLMPGYITEEAILHGVETRTSSPVQITRTSDTLECLNIPNLYPAGEGAGYAGGIVSAAVDGLKIARKIVEKCS